MTHLAAIHDFVEPVPVCLHTAAFSDAIELLEQHSVDRLVIINEQQHPIGILHARRLISAAKNSEALDPALIEELPFLGINESLKEIYFEQSSARFWAVLDDDRHLLGLVDSFYLRKLMAVETQLDQKQPELARHSSESVWHQAKSDASPEVLHSRTKQRIQQSIERQRLLVEEIKQSYQETKHLKHQLRHRVTQLGQERSSEPEMSLSQPELLTTSGTALRSLMQFLDRLPLPLMLQTQAGEVVARNALWSGQFGDLVDVNWIQRDAASVLESGSPAPINPLCQIGSTPNTCICVCPLKNGQEKIVQFVKIPLGTLLLDREVETPTLGRTAVERSFRLATLAQSTELLERSSLTPEENLWLVLAQDVTEQQQLSRELAAKNADLVQLNRLKDEFLACISHELRTPLTAVLGLSSLLKDQRSGTLNERQVRYAQLIYRSGRHLMAIVNDILDLTRIETGQLELTFYAVNIASVCDRAFEQASQLCLEEEKPEAQGAIAQTAILPEFKLEIEPGLETLVADELRLRQMLVHLLSNAVKFTASTGKIGLKVSRWEGWIAFTVWDTGIGIPAEKQHLIFQKFQQLENPLTRRFEGAGLGLVLTQRLARLHGGDISFVSREDQGSQFTLLLPPTHPQPTQSIVVPIAHAASNRLILIVEAVVRSIEHLSEQLTELGYRVVIARSGTEAVEKARRLQPFAVLLNPLLPTLSGWDVLTLLKAEPQTRQIPVIITGTRGDREQASRNQADGFLGLPIVQKSLQQVLRQLSIDDIPVTVEPPTTSQVVLRLSPTRYGEMRRAGNGDPINLNVLLHQHHYRVLEADDLEQAELLAQVWKPNVVLLDAAVPDPMTYLKLLSECTFLASLPLVTLDLETTQAANQMPGLTVFPCLAPVIDPALSTGQSETSALLQVIQVAAGFAWRPSVLAIDSTQLFSEDGIESTWLQALMQYLQTAEFRGTIARSWQEVMQKLAVQSVDLVLLHWHCDRVNEFTQARLADLKQLPEKPPILVIRHQEECELPEEVSAIAAQILPPLSMEELLEQINSLLSQSS